MKDWQSQAHVKWDCKSHVVLLPKSRRKVLSGRMRRGIGHILRELCRQKEIELGEGKAMSDHIPMLLSTAPSNRGTSETPRKWLRSSANSGP